MLIPVLTIMQKIRGIRISGRNFSSRQMLMVPDRPIIMTDHSAYNGKSLQTYLVKDWISLHEFGHGYEGAIASQENPFVETTNNILGYYFEPTYRPAEDFWLAAR